VRVHTDGYTDTLTDANRFYNLSHAICYSYRADNISIQIIITAYIIASTVSKFQSINQSLL